MIKVATKVAIVIEALKYYTVFGAKIKECSKLIDTDVIFLKFQI